MRCRCAASPPTSAPPTRAVYSLFGSKDGLLAALAARPFELLQEGLDALPVTDDAAADLVAAALMFRRFSSEHPALFVLGIQHVPVSEAVAAVAWRSLDVLKAKVQRLADAGRLNGRTVEGATLQFHALCEGMAAVERRGMGVADWEAMWRQAFAALVAGFTANQPLTGDGLPPGVERLERLLRLGVAGGRLGRGARVVPRRRVGQLLLERAPASPRPPRSPPRASCARAAVASTWPSPRPAPAAWRLARGAGFGALGRPLRLRALLAHAHVLGPAADVGVQRAGPRPRSCACRRRRAARGRARSAAASPGSACSAASSASRLSRSRWLVGSSRISTFAPEWTRIASDSRRRSPPESPSSGFSAVLAAEQEAAEQRRAPCSASARSRAAPASSTVPGRPELLGVLGEQAELDVVAAAQLAARRARARRRAP